MTEKEIIVGCIQGHQGAQNALYNKYAGKVMGICIRYTNNREEAEDIFQDSFVKIFQNIQHVKTPEYLGRWIKKLVVNTAVNHYHQNKKRNGHLLLEYNELSNHEYENILSNVTIPELLKMINSLPKGYRIVFNLAVVDGYSHKEISNMMDISEGTSKSQLYKAKNMLRQKFKFLNKINHVDENMG